MTASAWGIRAAALLAVVVAAVLALPSAAQSDGETRDVSGRVVNGSGDAPPPVGLAVTLHRQGAESYDELKTVTDGDGRFAFPRVALAPQALYGVTTRYKGVVYGLDVDLRTPSPPQVTITIYETSEEQSLLIVSSSSLLIPRVDKIARRVSALEIVNVVNDSDLTYVPGPGPMELLRFGLPRGAEALQIDTALVAADVIQVDRGFALTASVPPGEHEVMFSYTFAYEESDAAFEKSYLYGAEKVRIIMPYEIGDLSSADLGPANETMIGDRSYQVIEAADVPAGYRARIALASLPQATFWDRARVEAREFPYEMSAPIALAALMGALIAFALRRRRAARGADGEAQSREALAAIVEETSELDAAFQRGELSEALYHAKRRELLGRMLAQSPSGPPE